MMPVVSHTPVTGMDVRVLRDAAVRAAWTEVEVLERLDPAQARKTFADQLRAQAAHARSSLRPLTPWPDQPDQVFDILVGDPNHTRIRRTLDYVLPGDRVLEVGVGFGYVAGILLRDAGIAGYTGIDLDEHRVVALRQMAETNGLADGLTDGESARRIEAMVKNIYDLTPQWVAERDPDFVLLAEVLEHVPDAESALAKLAACLRDDACVLFTVPMLGRLENVWGHVSLFDAARVRRMAHAAGLVIQFVEPVYGQWLFVLASRTDAVLPRVARLMAGPERPRAVTSSPPPVPRFEPVRLTDATCRTWGEGPRTVEVTSGEDGAHCHVVGARPRGRGRQYGGVEVDVPGDMVLRLELEFDRPDDIRGVYVDLRSSEGKRSARWVWNCARQPPQPGSRTFVLRPGRGHGPFRSQGPAQVCGARTAYVFVEVAPRGTASFRIRRAAAVAAGRDVVER